MANFKTKPEGTLVIIVIFFILFNFSFHAKPVVAAEVAVSDSSLPSIYFAGGCFWGVEHYFQQLDGVVTAVSGYANGKITNPSYEDVIYRETDHAETVQVVYQPQIISLEELLAHFFRIVDPHSLNRQGNDIGRQYRSGIYSESQHDQAKIAAALLSLQAQFEQPVMIENRPLAQFYPAEEYHQKYLVKNPAGYCHINPQLALEPLTDEELAITRPGYLQDRSFKAPSREALQQILTPAQFAISQQDATEPSFTHIYNDIYRPGIYVDIISGEPLFSAKHKYDAGCGWPSFTQPLISKNISELEDLSFGMKRTEVRSSNANSHLGHLFNDGPQEQGGLRYCINGNSLRFIPLEKMAELGYEEFIEECK